jgi:TRAP-type transport system periplasmic protein
MRKGNGRRDMLSRAGLTMPVLGLILVALLVVSGCGAGEEKPDTVYKLQMATFWPSTDFQVVEGHMRWIEEIEKRTDGRVKISLHAGEALLGAREIYEGVATGVADIGTTCPAYTPGLFPLTAVFELPGFLNDNAVVASMTAHEGYKRIRDGLDHDEYGDVKVLLFWATGPGDLLTRDPVRTLEDLSGKTIRTVGGTVPVIQSLGATPVSMPMSESYLALDQRLVDGILAPTDVLEGFRLAEVVKYATGTPFIYNVVFMKVMNRETWDSLPADIQAVFEELNDEYALAYGKLREDYRLKGLTYGVDEFGLEVISLSGEEDARWRSRIEPQAVGWVERTEAAGLPGSEALEIARELDTRFSEEYGTYGVTAGTD